MKKFIASTLTLLTFTMTANAQTFTQHIQQHRQGMGTVTVTQSNAIDQLVNNNDLPNNNRHAQSLSNTGKEKPATTIKADKNPKTKNTQEEKTATARKEQRPAERATAKVTENKEAARNNIRETERSSAERNTERKSEEKKEEAREDELVIPTVDMRKKVMRGSRKVTGYRVQAFAGGNTRADKLKAQQAGNDIKMRFPDQPIYVHFYSPRWICRMGNYRSYEEAHRMLRAVKAMGYKAATIVKGKITVN